LALPDGLSTNPGKAAKSASAALTAAPVPRGIAVAAAAAVCKNKQKGLSQNYFSLPNSSL